MLKINVLKGNPLNHRLCQSSRIYCALKFSGYRAREMQVGRSCYHLNERFIHRVTPSWKKHSAKQIPAVHSLQNVETYLLTSTLMSIGCEKDFFRRGVPCQKDCGFWCYHITVKWKECFRILAKITLTSDSGPPFHCYWALAVPLHSSTDITRFSSHSIYQMLME